MPRPNPTRRLTSRRRIPSAKRSYARYQPKGTHSNAERGLAIEVCREDDGRWLALIDELPSVMSYGCSRDQALNAVQGLAVQVIADRLNTGEEAPDLSKLFHAVQA